MRGGHKSKLESIVVTSTVGIDQPSNPRSAAVKGKTHTRRSCGTEIASRAGTTARAVGDGAKPAYASRMSSKASGQGARFLEHFMSEFSFPYAQRIAKLWLTWQDPFTALRSLFLTSSRVIAATRPVANCAIPFWV